MSNSHLEPLNRGYGYLRSIFKIDEPTQYVFSVYHYETITTSVYGMQTFGIVCKI